MSSTALLARAACALALILSSAAPAAAAELSVQFRTMKGHLQTISIAMTQPEAARLMASPSALDELVTRARAKYADKLGYNERVNGPDYYKIVPGLRVEKVAIRGDGGGDEQPVRDRVRDRERDDEQGDDVDRKKKRTRGAGAKKSGNDKKW